MICIIICYCFTHGIGGKDTMVAINLCKWLQRRTQALAAEWFIGLLIIRESWKTWIKQVHCCVRGSAVVMVWASVSVSRMPIISSKTTQKYRIAATELPLFDRFTSSVYWWLRAASKVSSWRVCWEEWLKQVANWLHPSWMTLSIKIMSFAVEKLIKSLLLLNRHRVIEIPILERG
jgi:hypothetical protein